jgi:hypothetical protein
MMTGFLSGVSFAETKKTFGFNYDVNVSHSDNGFQKQDGAKDPAATVSIGQTAYLSFNLETTDSVVGDAYVNLMADNFHDMVEVAKASKGFGKMFTLAAGKDYLKFGGYDNMNNGYATIFVSPYTANLAPMATSQTMAMATAHMGVVGNLSLMVTNDVVAGTDADSDGVDDVTGDNISWLHHNTSTKQPAYMVEWTGTFGPVTPLLQYLSYDIAKSHQISFGAKLDLAGLVAYVDYVHDLRAANTAAGNRMTNFRNVVADVSYNAGEVTPFVKYATFSAIQPDTDHQGNQSATSYNDNGTTWMVGVNVNAISDSFVPYLAVVQASSDVLKDNTAVSGSTETKTNLSMMVGVSGSI